MEHEEELCFTELHDAVFIGDIDLVEDLISRGFDVDARSPLGTPLQRAAVRVLLAHKADPKSYSQNAPSPVVASIMAQSLPCLKLLVEAGADPDDDACGLVPLLIAAYEGETEIIKYLLQVGANPDVEAYDGMKPMEVAALRGHEEDFKILFRVTSTIPTYPHWSPDGVMRHIDSSEARKQRGLIREENFKQAKTMAEDALCEKNYSTAISSYNKWLNYITGECCDGGPLDPEYKNVCQFFQYVRTKLEDDDYICWTTTLVSWYFLQLILHLADKAKDVQGFEYNMCLLLCLVSCKNREVGKILRPPLLVLGLSSVLYSLLVYELEYLSAGRQPDRHIVLENVLEKVPFVIDSFENCYVKTKLLLLVCEVVKLPNADEMERTLCNRCGDNTHSSEKCCWLSTPCCIRKCRGSRILKQSSQIQSLGKFFLTCRACGDFQWLEDARASSLVPLENLRCRQLNCAGFRKVNTTMKKTENEGRKFLNCTECGKDFEWLDTLLAWLRSNIELAPSSSSSTVTSSSSSKKDKKVKITLEIDDDGLSKEFEFHCKIR